MLPAVNELYTVTVVVFCPVQLLLSVTVRVYDPDSPEPAIVLTVGLCTLLLKLLGPLQE